MYRTSGGRRPYRKPWIYNKKEGLYSRGPYCQFISYPRFKELDEFILEGKMVRPSLLKAVLMWVSR